MKQCDEGMHQFMVAERRAAAVRVAAAQAGARQEAHCRNMAATMAAAAAKQRHEEEVKGICPRGNNKVVINIFHVYDKCLFLMLELY
jgi:hypothetical protein